MKDTVLAVDAREAARLLGLSSNTVAAPVSRKVLPSRKVGRRRIIPVSALNVFLDARSDFDLRRSAGGQ